MVAEGSARVDQAKKPKPVIITGFEEFDVIEEPVERRRESGRVLIGSTEDLFGGEVEDKVKDVKEEIDSCQSVSPARPTVQPSNVADGHAGCCHFTSIEFMDSLKSGAPSRSSAGTCSLSVMLTVYLLCSSCVLTLVEGEYAGQDPLADVILLPDDRLVKTEDGNWHNTQREKIDFVDACGYVEPTLAAGLASHSLSHGCHLWAAHNFTAGIQRELERDALVDLFHQLNGVGWRTRDGWLVGEPCWNGWYGVECNEFGFVRSLSLSENRLRGSIPASISHLTYLEELYLHNAADSYHSFSNEDANRISGSLPRMGSLRRLQVLDISGNEVEALPYDLYVNTNLEILSASRNRLRTLPIYLGRLRKLKILQLQDNLIDAVLPIEEVCKLSSIQVFDLGNNTISGTLSNCLSELDPLVFDLSASHPGGMPVGKGITGEFPTSIIPTWRSIADGYLSVYFQFYMTGHISSACSDVRYCYQFMYDTHGDLTWASAGEIPDVVMETVNLARGQQSPCLAPVALGEMLAAQFHSQMLLTAVRGTASRSILSVQAPLCMRARRLFSTNTTLFTKSHEWIKVDGKSATIGITNYAQDQLGEIVYVDFPPIGTKLKGGDTMCTLESVKAVGEVYCPLPKGGEVAEVNSALEDTPSQVNEAAEGDGWLVKLDFDGNIEADGDTYLTAEQYQEKIVVPGE
ncbi:hypothetical protein FOZ62_020363 [Perkinsus olseni]|uniref:Lipoyl-binding domain-containing protein n=1 Tax=Perkinsus olseni TaxID=32597 RepID=A0A7J6SDJ4_PEROL|nr:hypothetical protein FOZ62_020363 [Perkinsus olseni]